MSDFFKCKCKRVSIHEHTLWCNMTAHQMVMDDDRVELDGSMCDGHENGDPVHCTDYCVFEGDEIRCIMCNTRWVHSDD